MKRTTIVTDEGLLLEIKQLAMEESQSVSEVITAALRDYVRAKRQGIRGRISFVGMGDSGRDHLSERMEEIMAQDPRRHQED